MTLYHYTIILFSLCTTVLPVITSVYLEVGQTSYTVNETDSVVFQCTATGIPTPGLMFNFGDIATKVDIVDTSTPVEVARSQDGETVFQVTRTAVINSTVDSDSGVYMCTASNNVGNGLETVEESSFELTVQGSSTLCTVYINCYATSEHCYAHL